MLAHSLDNSAGMVTISTMRHNLQCDCMVSFLVLPMHEVTVVAVSEGGDVIARSLESESVQVAGIIGAHS